MAEETPKPEGLTAEQLHEKHPEIYQAVFRKGYGKGKAEGSKDSQEATTKMEALTAQNQTLAEEVEALKAKSPDLDAIRSQYETALQQKDREWSEKLTQAMSTVETMQTQNARSRMIAALQAQRVDPVVAELFADKALPRVKPEGAGYTVYQSDGVTPFDANGQDPFEILAKDIASAIPKRFVEPERNTLTPRPGETSQSDKVADWTEEQKVAYIRAHGSEAYNKLYVSQIS